MSEFPPGRRPDKVEHLKQSGEMCIGIEVPDDQTQLGMLFRQLRRPAVHLATI
jgi:hypothetical protein